MDLFKPHTPRLLILILVMTGCIQRSDVREQSNHEKLQYAISKKEATSVPKQVREQVIQSRFADTIPISQMPSEGSKALTLADSDYYIPVKEPAKTVLIKRELSRQASQYKSISDHKTNSFDTDSFFRNGRIHSGIYLTIIIDNDLFDYTDYYYTSGQSIEFYHPALSASPLSYLLPGMRGSVNYHSLSLTQSLYTPRELEIDSILSGDRPFASYLILSHKKYSLNPLNRSRMESRLDLGVIGPNSLGQAAQDIIHTNKPVGWANQVTNDFVLNYGLKYEKSIYENNCFEMAWFGGGQAGTLYDNLSGGLFLQIGKTNGRYESLFQTTRGKTNYLKRIRYYTNLSLENKLVLFDATLQGGMFNRNSVYTIPGEMVQRYVFSGIFGFGFGLGPFTLEAEQVFLTPEFEGGRHHFWFRIKSSVQFN